MVAIQSIVVRSVTELFLNLFLQTDEFLFLTFKHPIVTEQRIKKTTLADELPIT
jgi:hypothetical protein